MHLSSNFFMQAIYCSEKEEGAGVGSYGVSVIPYDVKLEICGQLVPPDKRTGNLQRTMKGRVGGDCKREITG